MTLQKFNRRSAVALWLQDRRRGRRAPLLKPQYPGLLVWEWPYANPYKWLVYWSNTLAGPWNFVEDYWHYGASRQFAPDGGSPYHFVVGVDEFGNEVTGRSNAVRPDDAPEPTALLDGLDNYFRPEAGQVFARSLGVTDAFDGDPFAGFEEGYETAGSGYYATTVYCDLFAYKTVLGVNRYAGVMKSSFPSTGSALYVGDGGIAWPAWGTMSSWPTGFLVRRVIDGVVSHRLVSAATMAAGWVDDDTGWTAGMPHSFASPPVVSKTLFRMNGESQGVGTSTATVTSPLGGLAFDCSDGSFMAHVMAEAQHRTMDQTIAYWFCPSFNTRCSMWVGHSWDINFLSDHIGSEVPGTVVFNGYNVRATLDNHVEGDWYLVVQRGDSVTELTTVNVTRLRDGASVMAVGPFDSGPDGTVTPLTDLMDFERGGYDCVLAFGGGYFWWNFGSGYVDRLATWNRSLTNAETDALFNSGLGWSPS